ncbi:MAG TPA: DNA methyltransferase [Candidatus Pacearchaeota archaeon]|nr:DNA methyltransferase [Candidatus Pacearchaeota archaeon]
MSLTAPKIRNTFINLKPDDRWSFKLADRKQMYAYTHGYHRYPAKFIPQIVRQLIKNYAPNGDEIIFDPFGGCGTTLVEAKLLGRKSVGLDINPIAKLITQVKVTPINPKLVEKYKVDFLNNYENLSKKIEHHQRISYWFDEKTIKELDDIYFNIKKIKNYEIRKFFLCAFSHNLKNCSRWLMKSIKPTIDKVKEIPVPKNSFLRHLNMMVKKNSEFYSALNENKSLDVQALMYRRDSTRSFPLEDNSIDLIITSPPYVTSYEYADLHQLSLLWFGDDPGHFKKWHKYSNEFNNFRKQFVGTSYKGVKKNLFDSTIAENIILDLEKEEKRLAMDVTNYFSDMKKIFSEMYRVLKEGKKACIIIGDTSLRGVEILNAETAVEQMSNIGFRKVKFIKREVSNKMITPWRDQNTGKFTGLDNPAKKRVYEFEYIIIMEK